MTAGDGQDGSGTGPRTLRRIEGGQGGRSGTGGPGDGEGPGTDDSGGPGTDDGGGPGTGARIHLVRFAPAKLNLTLAVLGRREDGYHSLHSVMVPLALGDALTVTVPHAARHDTLRISGIALGVDPDNLVLRAVAATRAAVEESWPGAPVRPPWLAARLVKRIPVAAGLGGGSSDAAAAIEAALAAWHTTMPFADRARLAASLGSDVSFFLARANALITGRGEFVEPLPEISGEPPAILLVTPQLPVATPDVFAAYAAGARPGDPARARRISEHLAGDLRGGMTSSGLLDLAADLAAANDLLPAATTVEPGLVDFMHSLERHLGRPVCQSGSGPTQWILYPTLADARKAGRSVRIALSDGSLPSVGIGEPFVAATAIMPPHLPPSDVQPAIAGRTYGPRTVHNEET